MRTSNGVAGAQVPAGRVGIVAHITATLLLYNNKKQAARVQVSRFPLGEGAKHAAMAAHNHRCPNLVGLAAESLRNLMP